jgi:hypothetical protein
VISHDLGDPVAAGLLPAAGRVRLGDQFDVRAVGGQQPVHDRFHAWVGDQGDRVPVDGRGQGKAQPQRATGGFDDHGTRHELAALPGLVDHVQRGPVFHATGIAAFEFRPVAAAGLADPQHRGVADGGGGGVAARCGCQQLGRCGESCLHRTCLFEAKQWV